jgi:nucleoside-diphosphate-sugar epimerase
MISTGQVYLVRQDCPRPARECDYDGALMPEPDEPDDHEEWSYGVYKREAEDVLASEWMASGFPSTRLRIPMVNGERDHFRRIEGYLWRLLDGGPLILPDGGDHRVRHVYGGAVVGAVVELLGNSSSFGQVYNLAQDETPTLSELIAMLADSVGARAELVAVPTAAVRGAGLDPVSISPFSGRWMSFLDPARAREELGFHHEPLETYLDKVTACFLDHPPSQPPDGYRKRDVELRLAAKWIK